MLRTTARVVAMAAAFSVVAYLIHARTEYDHWRQVAAEGTAEADRLDRALESAWADRLDRPPDLAAVAPR